MQEANVEAEVAVPGVRRRRALPKIAVRMEKGDML
jgi:hypothetical protein